MKGKGFKNTRKGATLHKINTEIAVAHCLTMLANMGAVTFSQFRDPIWADLVRRKMASANAYDCATARIRRAIGRLKVPQVECMGILFPYVMTTKNENGATVYTRFEDWSEEDINAHLKIVADQRLADGASEAKQQANYEVLKNAMAAHGVTHCGQLAFKWLSSDDENDEDGEPEDA